jgi:branched-chain amino acid transport system permease protein
MTHRSIGAAVVALALLALAGTTFVLSEYQIYQFTMVAVFAIVILGTNILTGLAGQLSLATNAFVAVGAYLAAILTVDHDWPWYATIPVAALMGFLVGWGFSLPALRLKGLYLATATLALGVAVVPVLKRADPITHGASGILVPRPESPVSWLEGYQWRFFVTLAVALIVFALARNLLKAHVGRALVAIRDNEVVAAIEGVNLAYYKGLAFAMSSALAAVTGALLCFNVGIVEPDTYPINLSVMVLASSVLGGASTVVGAIVGGVIYVYLPTYANDFNQALVGLIYGMTIVIFMVWMPQGIVGKLAALVLQRRNEKSGRSDLAIPGTNATQSTTIAGRT